MRKVNFEERVKIIPLDMNALHDETESGLGELVQSLSGGTGNILFKNIFNAAVLAPPDIRITVPEQWFGVSGVPAKIPLQTITLGPVATPDYFRIFFVIRRMDVIQNRDQYTIVGGVITIATMPVVTRKNIVPRIEVTASGNPLIAPGPPVLGPNDIGYVEYGWVTWDGVTLTSNHNTPAIYTFPGYAVGVGPHAGSHLSTGTDPVQHAALGGPLGSVEGLMPPGSYAVLTQAIQAVGVDVACPYLTAVVSGDNSPGNPKTVGLRVRHNQSLAVIDVGGTKYLGLNFVSGPYRGSSGRPADAEHRHPPGDMPIVLQTARVTIGSTSLGTVVTVPAFTGLTKVHSVQVYWAPPSIVDKPRFECGWFRGQNGRVGVKPLVTDDQEVRLEIGGYALIELTTDALALAVAAVGGSSNWERAGSEAFATSGELYVKVIGER